MRKKLYKFGKYLFARYDRDCNGDIWEDQCYGSMNITKCNQNRIDAGLEGEDLTKYEELIERTKLYDELQEYNLTTA